MTSYNKIVGGICILIGMLLLQGCVQVTHSPVIAKSSETVTYTAKAVYIAKAPATVQIYVNGALAKTCNGVAAGGTCSYVGGPYPTYQGATVSYLARMTDSNGQTNTAGFYYFAITNNSYTWSLNAMPARVSGTTQEREDLVFHRATDYTSFGTFIGAVEDKMYDVYAQQATINLPSNFDSFNFWVYSRAATTTSCGTVDALADTDIPWRDDDAVLHAADFQDCTNLGLNHFTAEGHNTKAFLHESGHAVFGLADEYDGPTAYFEPAIEPNIWDTEAECRAEQTAKGRDPNACWRFTTLSGGWWGIHKLASSAVPSTVMQQGMVGDPWGIEAGERVDWFFREGIGR